MRSKNDEFIICAIRKTLVIFSSYDDGFDVLDGYQDKWNLQISHVTKYNFQWNWCSVENLIKPINSLVAY